MDLLVVFLPFWFPAGDTGTVFQRGSISGDHNGAISSDKFIAVADQGSVAYRKGLYSDTVIFINNTRFFNFCYIYLIALFICLFKAMDTEINISFIGH